MSLLGKKFGLKAWKLGLELNPNHIFRAGPEHESECGHRRHGESNTSSNNDESTYLLFQDSNDSMNSNI